MLQWATLQTCMCLSRELNCKMLLFAALFIAFTAVASTEDEEFAMVGFFYVKIKFESLKNIRSWISKETLIWLITWTKSYFSFSLFVSFITLRFFATFANSRSVLSISTSIYTYQIFTVVKNGVSAWLLCYGWVCYKKRRCKKSLRYISQSSNCQRGISRKKKKTATKEKRLQKLCRTLTSQIPVRVPIK